MTCGRCPHDATRPLSTPPVAEQNCRNERTTHAGAVSVANPCTRSQVHHYAPMVVHYRVLVNAHRKCARWEHCPGLTHNWLTNSLNLRCNSTCSFQVHQG